MTRLAAGMIALSLSAVAHAEPAPLLPPEPAAQVEGSGKLWSMVGVGGVYSVALTWVLVRYYIAKTPADAITIRSDGWFGADTYAGGADKLGHLWGNYALTRGCSQLLIHGGWDELTADVVSASLAAAFYTWSEVTDGYYGWGFSYSDVVFNLLGDGLGILMRRWRGLDDLLDLKVSYFPSSDFRDEVSEHGFVAAGEDYTGQSVMLAFHLKAIPYARDVSWLHYFDLTVGYTTDGYEPRRDDPSRSITFGVSLNLQHILRGLEGPGGDVARFAAEIWAPPLTAIDLVGVKP